MANVRNLLSGVLPWLPQEKILDGPWGSGTELLAGGPLFEKEQMVERDFEKGCDEMKRFFLALGVGALVLAAVFCAGRWGWKVLGFRACQGAGIESVEVGERIVTIKGFYPGSFPEGFCGYYAEEQDGTLYVGFRFSTVFGFFETGQFAVDIPVKGEVREVVLRSGNGETVLWMASASEGE